MTERVSLVEAYDNKDVVSQIYRIREIAQGAEDKSAEAVQKADAAVAVVPVVEAAVATANAASQAAQQAAGQVTDCVKKTGSAVPQVISGTGGLQIAGDLSVGGDLTVSADGHVHMDASDIEVANMAIEKSGLKTVLSNDNGIDAPDTVVGTLDAAIVNAKRLIEEINAKLDSYAAMVRTSGNQHISGIKTWDAIVAPLRNASHETGWKEIFRIINVEVQTVSTNLYGRFYDKSYGRVIDFVAGGRTGQYYTPYISVSAHPELFKITLNDDLSLSIWVSVQRYFAVALEYERGNADISYAISRYITKGTLNVGSNPPSGDGYIYVVDGTVME